MLWCTCRATNTHRHILKYICWNKLNIEFAKTTAGSLSWFFFSKQVGLSVSGQVDLSSVCGEEAQAVFWPPVSYERSQKFDWLVDIKKYLGICCKFVSWEAMWQHWTFWEQKNLNKDIHPTYQAFHGRNGSIEEGGRFNQDWEMSWHTNWLTLRGERKVKGDSCVLSSRVGKWQSWAWRYKNTLGHSEQRCDML